MILTFSIKVSFSSLNWIQATRISNYLNIIIEDKHLVINIQNETFFIVLGHYYHEELTALLLQTTLPMKWEQLQTQPPVPGWAPWAGQGWCQGDRAGQGCCHGGRIPCQAAPEALCAHMLMQHPSVSQAVWGFAHSTEELCLLKGRVNVKGICVTSCSSGVCSTSNDFSKKINIKTLN